MNNVCFFHGAVIIRAVRDASYKSLLVYQGNLSSYVINGSSGVYVKYSKKKLPPWSFTFSEEHVGEVAEMNDCLGRVYIALACDEDGVCCLDWDEFRTVISVESKSYPKWISVSRMRGEKYSVKGSEGKLKHKIGNADFPRKVY